MRIQPGVGYNFDSSNKGFTLDVSDPFPSSDIKELCPFTILDRSSGSDYKFSAVPGTVNSIIPQIGIAADSTKRLDQMPVPTTAYNFDGSGYSYIHLKVSALWGSYPVTFPVTDQTDILYPRIISNSTQQFATVDSVFFLLATVYKNPTTNAISITQLTCGSQWCDRIQVGNGESDIPYYFFARC